ncbi:hypothetical protein ES703_78806 [subsurface metagenome]
MVDRVNPWMVRDLDDVVLWVDGGIWGNSVWDSDVEEEGEEEDDVSARVQAV